MTSGRIWGRVWPRWESVDPGHGDPLRAGGGSLQSLFHTFDALVYIVVDQDHVEEMAVEVEDGVRLLLDGLQCFRLVWRYNMGHDDGFGERFG